MPRDFIDVLIPATGRVERLHRKVARLLGLTEHRPLPGESGPEPAYLPPATLIVPPSETDGTPEPPAAQPDPTN